MRIFGFVILPFLFFLYNAGEMYLKLNHSSLCESTGCKLADNLLRFDSIYLNGAGVLAGLMLFILGWLTYKEKIDKRYFYLFLFVSILFETIMLGYQFYASPVMCKFCMGVYSFLILIAIFTAREKFLLIVPAVLALIVALGSLKISNIAPSVTADGTYLIQSPTCPHCKKVKAYLKEHNIEFKKLPIDEAKNQNFITFLGYHTIPMLIIKDKSTIKALNGDEAIISYYEHKDSQSSEEAKEEESSSTVSEPAQAIDVDSLYGKVGGDEGCGFLPIEKEESCDTPDSNKSE